MSDEDYDKYPKSLRAYARERRKVDPNFKFFPKGDPTAPKHDVESAECMAHVSVGSRCEVQPGGRRGVVEFVGHVPALAAGYWVSAWDVVFAAMATMDFAWLHVHLLHPGFMQLCRLARSVVAAR